MQSRKYWSVWYDGWWNLLSSARGDICIVTKLSFHTLHLPYECLQRLREVQTKCKNPHHNKQLFRWKFWYLVKRVPAIRLHVCHLLHITCSFYANFSNPHLQIHGAESFFLVSWSRNSTPLWNPKVHYRVHKSLTLVRIQDTPSHHT
jgi:hypothetical protein